jgi:hypothetical protein
MEDLHIYSQPGAFDWGLGNPGVISLVLATLIVASWCFAFFNRGGFWISLGLSLILGAVLVAVCPTWGSIVGAATGLGSIGIWSYPHWSRSRVIPIGAALLVLVAAGLWVPMPPTTPQKGGPKKHSEEGIPIASRLLLWKAVPHMLLDAPDGWEKSDPNGWDFYGTGPSYVLGYQPFKEAFQDYRTLVSGHFTWLAEHDWTKRILYVCAWALMGVLVWPSPKCRSLAIPSAIWIALGVAGFFTPALTAPAAWLVPLAASVAALGWRLRFRAWPALWAWIATPLGASALFLLLIFAGAALFPLQVPVREEGNRTIVGYGSPSVWFIYPYVDVLGHHFGHGIRQIVLEARDRGRPMAIGIAHSLDEVDLKDEADTIYVFSHRNIGYPLPANARRLIFINTCLAGSVEWPASRMGKKDAALMGEKMLNNNTDGLAKDKDRWKQIQAEDPTFTLSVLDSTGAFFPMQKWKDPVLNVILEEQSK